LGSDICWASAEVSAIKREGVVRLLRHSVDVVVPAEGFMDIQT
jgi:hypothetical protein